jgi:hypothetical protein
VYPYFFGDESMTVFDSIKEPNRDETLAIPFYGWLKNPVEGMIRYAMRTGKYTEWQLKYPFLEKFHTADQIKLFSETAQYTINSFRNAMVESGKTKNIDEKQADADFNELLMNIDPNTTSSTIMELMLMKLLTEDFVKCVYIYEPVMSTTVKNYIAKVFNDNVDKIYLVEANVREMIESDNPKFTTVYIEDLELFMDVLQLYTEEDMQKYMAETFYILPAKSSLTEHAKETSATLGILPKDEDAFKYKNFIDGTLAKVKSMADFFQLKIISIDKNGG